MHWIAAAVVINLLALGVIVAVNSSLRSYLTLVFDAETARDMDVGLINIANVSGRLLGTHLSRFSYQMGRHEQRIATAAILLFVNVVGTAFCATCRTFNQTVTLAPEGRLRKDCCMRFLLVIKHVTAATALAVWLHGAAQAGQVVVFAAASLKEAMDEVAERFEASTGHDVTASFAGSSALARQIEFGAPADVFVSASSDWMDQLEQKAVIAKDTRFNLLGNRLVLIGPSRNPLAVALTSDLDLMELLHGGRLAMALTKAVPAGIYGKAALQTLGLWESVAPSVAETDNVRAALALVALGAAPLGIVYATDAMAEPRVSVVGVFPAETHDKIVYPAAATSSAHSAQALAFLDYLRSEEAHVIFERYGFLVEVE